MRSGRQAGWLAALVAASCVVAGCGMGGDHASPAGVAAADEAGAPSAEECDWHEERLARELPVTDIPAPAPVEVGAEEEALPLRLVPDGLGICDQPGYGRGAALVDLDGDGWDDLFLADTDNRARGDEFGRSRFYRNVEGRFEPWDLGIDDEHVYMNGGGIFGDFDDDGQVDVVFVNGNNTGRSTLALYRNDLEGSGRFVDVTASAGITGEEGPWWGAAWGDVDGDGRLDLVVTGIDPILYRNEGDGTFADVTAERGVVYPPMSWGLQNPLLEDFTGDGRPDLFVAGTNGSVMLWNRGDGSFVDVTASSGVPSDQLMGVFSAAAADFDQDGAMDLWLGRWWFQDLVLLNDGTGKFTAHGTDVGIVTQVWDQSLTVLSLESESPGAGGENTMGLNVGDLTGDGYPDVVIGTGEPSRARAPIVFCAEPDPVTRVRFHRCTEPLSSTLGESRGHGTAIGDLDHDGLVDLVVNPGGFPVFDAETGSDTRESARVLLGVETELRDRIARVRLMTGPGPRAALGARVTVEGDETRHHVVQSAQGFQSQNSAVLLLDVGKAADVTIDWPDGRSEQRRIRGGSDLTIVQDAG